MGMFDDLIPQTEASPAAPAGMFDDLIPKSKPQATAASPAATPGGLESLWRGAKQGATFGLEPAIQGLSAASGEENSPIMGSAIMSPIRLATGATRLAAEKLGLGGAGAADAYEQRRKEELARNQAASDTNPLSYGAGELGGGLASAVATPVATPFKAAEGAGALSQLWRGGLNLAANGAIQGAAGAAGTGISEEQSPSDAAGSLAAGAGYGAAAGTALGGAGAALGPIARGIGRDVLGVGRDSYVTKTLGKNLQDSGVSITDPTSAAPGKALSSSGVSVNDLVNDVQAVHEAGNTSYTLADAVDGALGSTIGDMTGLNNPDAAATRKMLGQRQLDQRARVDSYLGMLIGAAPEDANDLSKGIAQSADVGTQDVAAGLRSAQADAVKPLYERAHADPVDVDNAAAPDRPKQPAQSLMEMVPRLNAEGALKDAKLFASREGKPVQWSTLEPWDYAKQALDDKIAKSYNPTTGMPTNDTRTLGTLKADLVNELDAQSASGSGAYGRARAVYKQYQDQIDALDRGAESIKPSYTREMVQRDMASMTPAQQAAYRVGHINALREQIANAANTGKLPTDFSTNAAQMQKLGTVIGDPAKFGALTQRMAEERRMSATFRQAANLPNSASSADVSNAIDILHSGHLLAHGSMFWPYAIARVAKNVFKDQSTRDWFLDHARKAVFSKDPRAAQQFVSKIKDVQAQANKPRRAALARTVSNMIGQSAATKPQAVAQYAPPPERPQHWRPVRAKGAQGSATHMFNPATGEMRPINAWDLPRTGQ